MSWIVYDHKKDCAINDPQHYDRGCTCGAWGEEYKMTDDKMDATPTSPIPPNAQGINSLDPLDPWRLEANGNKPRRIINPVIFNVFFNAIQIIISTAIYLALVTMGPYHAGRFLILTLHVESVSLFETWILGLPMLAGIAAGGVGVIGLGMGLRDSIKNAIFRMGYRKGKKREDT